MLMPSVFGKDLFDDFFDFQIYGYDISRPAKDAKEAVRSQEQEPYEDRCSRK